MFSKIYYIGIVMACTAGMLTVCNNPASNDSEDPQIPAGVTAIYTDGFGGDLSKWDDHYMITVGDNYPHMRISTDAAHTGKHSITSDSNKMALQFSLDDTVSIRTGIAGVQFYIMAKELGQANFTVEIGKNAGSSGGLGYAFGIGFDPNDSIKCKHWDMLGSESVHDSMVAPIQLNHWYKCSIEIDFSTRTVTYSIDDASITMDLPQAADMSKVDRLLVFRGTEVTRSGYGMTMCTDGAKQYYADDIVFYKK